MRRAPPAPRLPAAVELALQQRQVAEDAYRSNPAPHTKAAFLRADEAVRKAAIATARPVATGDAALVSFLRHGRP